MSRKKKIYNITVKTVANGYILQFEGAKQPDGYMYFSPEKLVEGIFAHIALKHNDTLSPAKISELMEAAIGWQGVEKAMHDIKSLQNKLETAKRNHYKVADLLIAERKRYMALRHELFILKQAAAQGDDTLMKDLTEAIMSRHKFYPELTYSGLAVDSDEPITTDEPTDDDDDDEETPETNA